MHSTELCVVRHNAHCAILSESLYGPISQVAWSHAEAGAVWVTGLARCRL